MRFVSVIACAVLLNACSSYGLRTYAEMGGGDKKKLERQAGEACGTNTACISKYIKSWDNTIQTRRADYSVSDKLWNQLNYQEREWVAARVGGSCGGNQNCVMANLQARDADILKERQRQTETAQAWANLSQSLQNTTNQLNQMAAQQRAYNQQAFQSQTYVPNYGGYFNQNKTTCIRSGNILTCR